ncbi:uncharacterized protein LOC105161266 [Sesamum indicum]|uniref:Uncharacterized protein LOC105161266 n=1 Tax=Sesamum indicum TaxID=4182 RepID=A0A6I9T2M5_SESIN|nr:uncharacterized protein LOC105161266 [Sesamum indicum]
MELLKHKHTQVPVWIRLRHLLVEFWTLEGLSAVASGVGKPLYPDAITKACTRLDFARVCVMLDVSSKFSKHLVLLMPTEDGTKVPCKVDVGYEWLPMKCRTCMSLGYDAKICPSTKPQPPQLVKVYVTHPPVGRHGLEEKEEEIGPPQEAVPKMPRGRARIEPPSPIGERTEIVLFNMFGILTDDDVSVALPYEGPNIRNPSYQYT